MNYNDTNKNTWVVKENAMAKLNITGIKGLTDKELVYISTVDRPSLLSNLAVESVMDAFYKSTTAEELTRELSQIGALSSEKIIELVAMAEFIRRQQNSKKVLSSPVDVYQAIRHLYSDEQEHFIVIGCNGGNEIVFKKVVTIGLINQTLAHPREVFADAISSRCISIFIAHNHPSGRLIPSPDDKAVTDRLVKAGELLGISVLDHLIFSDEGYFSFKEHHIL